MNAEHDGGSRVALMVGAWAWVAVPFAYGVYELIQKVTLLFTG